MSADTLNTPFILYEIRTRRRKENVANAFRFVAVLVLALLAAWIVMILAVPDRFAETSGSIVFTLAAILNMAFGSFLILLFVFWPFLFYFWANIKLVRQRTLLTLIQTALETDKPLQDIVRAYAAGCTRFYAARLGRFAQTLEAGRPLEAAVREHWGLFRYDIAGIVRLGGNAPETLRSIETTAQDERDFAPLQAHSIVRVIYLCTIVLWMVMIFNFMFIKILPEFEKMFYEFDTELPALTLLICKFSEIFVQYWFLMFPFMMLFILGVIVYLVLQTNTVVFRPFGFRRIFRNTDVAKFLMLFAVGIRRQFPIPAILQMYRWTVPSDYLRKKGADIQAAVEKGGDWIEAVRRSGFISEAEASLLHSAQRTGNTAAVLDQLALSKERSQIRKDDLFSKMAFIPLIFLLAAVVGTFVIAMFLPLISLVTSLV